MKKLNIALLALVVIMLGCAWFIPKINPEGKHQAPAVSCYTEVLEGHKYVIVVATNNTDIYMASHSCCPSISVSVVHAESCPCKKGQKVTVTRGNDIFDLDTSLFKNSSQSFRVRLRQASITVQHSLVSSVIWSCRLTASD